MKRVGAPLLLILLILIITLGGFIYYYTQTSAATATANVTASLLNEQLSDLRRQLASANSRVTAVQTQLSSASALLSSMQSQVASAGSQITTLQNDIAAQKSQVASLQGDLAASKAQVSSLQKDIESYKSQVASLQGQLTAAQAANITALQQQVSSLQSQNQDLTAILSLSKMTVAAGQMPVSQLAGHPFSIVTFNAEYAGYITIAGWTNSNDIYFTVTDSFAGYPYNEYRYPFGTGITPLKVPVMPGTITVYYNNANPNAVSTGTIRVTYYY